MSELDDSIERYLRIAEMKAELTELSDGAMAMETCEDIDQGIEEAFLEGVLAYERAEQVPFRRLLERDGLTIAEPDELSDDELQAKLDEVIQVLARRRTFLECTDHLSDRELYTHLVEVTFEETVPDLPPDDGANFHLDMTGGCSGEDIDTYLRYYADEGSRAHWAESWPDEAIPPHEDPPYDRDSHLPKPPPPPDPYDDPDVAAEWCGRYHAKLLAHLAAEGIVHGNVNHEPVAYAPPIAAVWAVESKNREGAIEWWALNGDCPSMLVSTEDIPNPRDFLRGISRKWNAEVDALEAANQQAEEAEEAGGQPRLRLQPFYMRRRYAGILERWASDDSAWDEEWRASK